MDMVKVNNKRCKGPNSKRFLLQTCGAGVSLRIVVRISVAE